MDTNGASRCEPAEQFTEDDFKTWLKLNRKHLSDDGWTSDEIAHLAIHTCYFSPRYVYPLLSHFNDAMTGSSIDNKAKMMVWTETWTIETVRGKVQLDDQWRFLVKKVSQGRDFDE